MEPNLVETSDGLISQGLIDQIVPLLWLVGILLLLAFLVFVALLIARQVLRSRKVVAGVFQKKVFRLMVPREFEEDGRREVKDVLSGIENLYANLGGLRAHRGFKTWLFGRYDSWSLEIVVGADRLVTFYVVVPDYLQEYVHKQFLSQYPHCQIEKMDDYNIFGQNGYVAAGYMTLAKANMFPIVTYKQMSTDPLDAVLSALSRLPENTTAAVQLVMRSAKEEWRKRGVDIASEMQQGKSLKDVMEKGGGSIFAGLAPDKLLSSGKKEDKPKEAYRLSPLEDQMIKAVEEKAAKAGMDVNLRMVAFAPTEGEAKDVLRQIAQTYSQYSGYQYANAFKATIKGAGVKLINDFIYRNFDETVGFVLNTEEANSLWHLPMDTCEVPNIRWLQARKLPPPVNAPKEGVIFGENDYRGEKTLIRIRDKDRQRHMYIIGMTGTGKSWLMSYLALQDIHAGKGVCIVDPHGSFVEDILPYIPKERYEDVVIFDAADMERPIGLNILEAKSPYEMDMAAQEMINIFYKLLPDPAMAGPMFEHYMRNALLALMADQEHPGTLVELARIFTDEAFRKDKLKHVKDILVKDFWEREYVASQKGSTGADMLSYVISKTGRFVENELMRNIIGQPKSGLNFRQLMDEGKILLMNLSKGRIGETNSNLLGLIAVSKIQMAAMARADMAEEKRKDFYLYIDEFQNFITDSISIILAEARKYRLNLIMGHQYIGQLVQNNDTKIKDAIFGNVGTMAAYRIGVDDAEVVAKQLGPKVSPFDLMNTERFSVYTRLLVDNQATDPFNMRVISFKEAFKPNPPEMVLALKELSRLKYGRDREEVIKDIMDNAKLGQLGKPAVPPVNPFAPANMASRPISATPASVTPPFSSNLPPAPPTPATPTNKPPVAPIVPKANIPTQADLDDIFKV